MVVHGAEKGFTRQEISLTQRTNTLTLLKRKGPHVSSVDPKITESETAFFRSLATTYFADADTLVECSICKEAVPLWEGLFVMYRFVGEIAHFACPYEAFRASSCNNGFNPHFDYDRFCAELEEKINKAVLMEGQAIGGELVDASRHAGE
jgi:hypothetical protein